MTCLPLLALALVLFALPSAALANGCPLPCSGQTASPPDSRLLFVQPDGEGGPLLAYETATGAVRFALPPGLASADGRWFLSAGVGRSTRLLRYRVQTGLVEREWTLRGRWRLAAVSPTGRWAALVRAGRDRTSILIGDVVRGTVVHVLRLRGRFEVETISRDGRRLFLIEHLTAAVGAAPRYLVRLYDVARARLAAQPLRGAGEPRVMAGLAWSGIASPNGRWLLTLYLDVRRESAFVHALDLERSSPRCIDLPSTGGFDRLKRYALTLSPDGKRLFAANAALGAVAEIDLASRRVAGTARFAPSSAGRGARAATLAGTISRNGRTLYFSDGRDLWAYDAAYGIVRGPYRTGAAIVGFGYGAGDRSVFAVRRDGTMIGFDAATGRRLRG